MELRLTYPVFLCNDLILFFPEAFDFFKGFAFGFGNELPYKPCGKDTHCSVYGIGKSMMEVFGQVGILIEDWECP